MYGDLGRAIEALFYAIIVLVVIAVPLALWKLVDIALYLYDHVGVTWK